MFQFALEEFWGTMVVGRRERLDQFVKAGPCARCLNFGVGRLFVKVEASQNHGYLSIIDASVEGANPFSFDLLVAYHIEKAQGFCKMDHLTEHFVNFVCLQGFDPSSYRQISIDLKLELKAYSLNTGQKQISLPKAPMA